MADVRQIVVTFRTQPKIKKELARVAKQMDRPVSYVINEAIRQKLESLKAKETAA